MRNQSQEPIDLSVVIPIYNEEKNIPELYKRLSLVAAKVTEKYELIFVNVLIGGV
jgi:dolichol-phosphate mannosyltransferase